MPVNESPAAVIVDGVNGVEIAVERNVAVPALVRPLLVAGIDGTGDAQALLVDGTGALATGVVQPATAVVTSVGQSAVVVVLLALNLARKGAIVFNHGSRVLFLKLGSGASSSDFTVRLLPDSTFALPFPAYTGLITGVWAGAGGGSALVTEMS